MVRSLTPFEELLLEAVHPKLPPNAQAFGFLDGPDRLKQFDAVLENSTAAVRQYQQDPIFTPLFMALLPTIGGMSLFGTSITVAGALSAIATTALTFGLQMMLMKPPKAEESRAPLTQVMPFVHYGVGETRIAGAMVCWEAAGSKLVSVQAIAGHRIDGFTRFYLHDDAVTVTGNKVNGIGDKYNPDVYLDWRLGETPETPYAQVASILSPKGLWSADHRGDGTASIAVVSNATSAKKFRGRFPYGPPSPSAVARLARCWDFRDPAQDPENESTWKFTKNPVVQLAWHECFNQYGNLLDWRKTILPVFDMWCEEADVCDELVPIAAGGTERRYECNGYSTTERDPKVFRNSIMAAMDGWTCERGDGALLVVAGKFREKYVATLTDEDVVGAQVSYGVLPSETINRLVPKITYPATDYVGTDVDWFEDHAGQIRLGRVLPQTMELDYVHQWRQGRRLGKREWLRLQAKTRGTIDIRLSGLNAIYAPWVRLETPRMIPRLNAAVIANRRSALNLMAGGYQMSFIQMPGSGHEIDHWDELTDEGMAPPIPIKPATDEIPIPIIDTVEAISSASSVVLRVMLVDPQRSDLTPVVFYRVKGQSNWSEQEFPDPIATAGLLVLNTNAVPGNATIEVTAAHRTTSSKTSTKTNPPIEIVATVDPVAPASLSTFSATGAAGQFTVGFTTPNDTHLATVAIYKVPSGQTLNRSAHIVLRPGVSLGIGHTFTVSSGAGSFNIFAEPLNGSNISGPMSGPALFTVT